MNPTASKSHKFSLEISLIISSKKKESYPLSEVKLYEQSENFTKEFSLNLLQIDPAASHISWALLGREMDLALPRPAKIMIGHTKRQQL